VQPWYPQATEGFVAQQTKSVPPSSAQVQRIALVNGFPPSIDRISARDSFSITTTDYNDASCIKIRAMMLNPPG
jgi:hypothetical protein